MTHEVVHIERDLVSYDVKLCSWNTAVVFLRLIAFLTVHRILILYL
jgi:hypothetical protein